MCLRVASDLVLTNPEIELVLGHVRLDAPSPNPSVIQRQVGVNNVRHNISPTHRQTTDRIRLNLSLLLKNHSGIIKTTAKSIITVEDKIGITDQIHQVWGQSYRRRK